MIELLTQILRHIVEHPDQVKITANQEGRDKVTLQVHVAPEDVGKVIGREGRIINALRLLVRAGAGKRFQKVGIELVGAGEPASRERAEQPEAV
ncbi:KH domain-containing protein [bacterium]|nr:KH domain-containing protein [bacterium]